jgi:hypothetical protein
VVRSYALGTPSAQRSGFSCRLAALANATKIDAGTDSKTQKTPDLVRRKAVGCNPMFGGTAVFALHISV